MSGDPNYPVIELEAENSKLKDDLIETQKKHIVELENKVNYLESLILRKYNEEERDAGSHMIAPPVLANRPHIRTVSELASRLEMRSRNASEGKKSAEEIIGEV